MVLLTSAGVGRQRALPRQRAGTGLGSTTVGEGSRERAAERLQRDGRRLVSVGVSKGRVVVPWDVVPGKGRGKFGASLPQGLPLKAKAPGYVRVLCPEGWRLSQTPRPSATQKLPEWDCVRSSVQTFVGCTGAH